MQQQQQINYNDLLNDSNAVLEMIPPTAVRSLLAAIASGKTPTYQGRNYTASEVRDLARRQQMGEKVRKISPFVCDFLAEQGAKVLYKGENASQLANPQQVFAAPPVISIEPVDTTVMCKVQELKVTNGMIDPIGVRVDEKGYPYGVKLREDIGVFCTFLKVDQFDGKFGWATVMKPTGPYDRFKLTGNIPFKILDTKVPDRKLKGIQLYEFLLQNKDYHKMVRTVVTALLQNDVVPLLENGKPVIRDGQFCDQYANTVKVHSDWSELIRDFRPAPLSFKVKPEYQGAQYIEAMFGQLNKKNFVRTNNAYYDGIDASIERDAIRSKIEIIMEYAQHFPKEVIIVTGVEEEGLALEKSLATFGIRSVIVSERSAFNYKGFHIWMKESNIEDNLAIADKLTVKPIVSKDGAILRAVYANKYAKGFGFMTNLLVNHYAIGKCPTATAVGKDPTQHCEVVVNGNRKKQVTYYFKQLPSRKPLHYYPYVYDTDGHKYVGTNSERLERTWLHMWTIISWVRSKVSYITRFKFPPATIHWRKGKDILDYTVEDLDFGETIQEVKKRDEEHVIVPTRMVVGPKRIDRDIDLDRVVIQKRPPPIKKVEKVEEKVPPLSRKIVDRTPPPEKEDGSESSDSQLLEED